MFGKTNAAIKYARVAASAIDLSGKSIAVVGGTDGLGRAIAKLAAARGASVTVVGRKFRDAGVPHLSFVQADLSLTSEAARIGRELPAEALDVTVFTTGIVPGPTRVTSAEGIEMDMAVSTLSRLVITAALAPRLRPSARVFIMGFPGAGEAGDLGETPDLNSERTYAGGFGKTHMNTVAGNEALVHHWAGKGLHVYGLHPGLIRTDIRVKAAGGFFAGVMESVIGYFAPTPETYAEKVVPLFVAPELDGHPGALFGQSGTPILPTPAFTRAEHVERWISEMGALVTKAQGRQVQPAVAAGASASS